MTGEAQSVHYSKESVSSEAVLLTVSEADEAHVEYRLRMREEHGPPQRGPAPAAGWPGLVPTPLLPRPNAVLPELAPPFAPAQGPPGAAAPPLPAPAPPPPASPSRRQAQRRQQRQAVPRYVGADEDVDDGEVGPDGAPARQPLMLMFLFLSSVTTQDAAWVHAATVKMLDFMDETFPELKIDHAIQFSDNCCPQYKCNSTLRLAKHLAELRHMLTSLTFLGPGHGKRVIDAVGGWWKRMVGEWNCANPTNQLTAADLPRVAAHLQANHSSSERKGKKIRHVEYVVITPEDVARSRALLATLEHPEYKGLHGAYHLTVPASPDEAVRGHDLSCFGLDADCSRCQLVHGALHTMEQCERSDLRVNLLSAHHPRGPAVEADQAETCEDQDNTEMEAYTLVSREAAEPELRRRATEARKVTRGSIIVCEEGQQSDGAPREVGAWLLESAGKQIKVCNTMRYCL
uniref:Uncharacterized protein n=1 Tax=Monostroma angicava TaxID=189348 RepID=A0A7U3NA00_9CHLO|nr:hypothetical protein [Monostroma angicava]